MTGKMAAPRAWHTLTRLPSGMVLAAGDETDSCTENFCMFAGSSATAELYDPSTGAFTSTGSMAASRETHTATLLKDGRVLIAGGTSYGGIGIFNGTTASAELYTPACSANGGAICPPDPWQQAIENQGGKQQSQFLAGKISIEPSTPNPAGAPGNAGLRCQYQAHCGLIDEIITASGNNGLQNISAEQWVANYRQALMTDPFQLATNAMKTAAGTDSYNFWQWAWFWQRSLTFTGAPAGFGVLGSLDNNGTISGIIAAGGGDGFALISAEQWVLYYRLATCAGCWDY